MRVLKKSIRELVAGLLRVKKSTVILFGVLLCVLLLQIAHRTLGWGQHAPLREGFESETSEERRERINMERLDAATASANDIIDSFDKESAENRRERAFKKIIDEIEKIPHVSERMDNVLRLVEFERETQFWNKLGLLHNLKKALKIDDFDSDEGKLAIRNLKSAARRATMVDSAAAKNAVMAAYEGGVDTPADAVSSAATGARDSIMDLF